MVLKYLVPTLLLFSACSGSSTGEEAPSLTGKELFEQNCAVCHGFDGRAMQNGAKDLTMSKLTRNEMMDIILNGKGSMPAFSHVVENDSLGLDLLKYIEDL